MQGIIGGVRTDSGPIAEVVASLASLARFLIEANSSRVKIAFERCEIYGVHLRTKIIENKRQFTSASFRIEILVFRIRICDVTLSSN